MQKKKKYIVAVAFWKGGLLLPAGKEIWLFPSEAKYLGHALSDPDKAPAAPAPAAEQPAAPVDAVPELTVAVTEEKPVRHKRHKRDAGADHGHAE